MKLNADGWRIRQCPIILLEASAHVAGLNANDGIFAGSIARIPLEDLYPDCAFLQLFVMAIQLVPDNVFQKLPASQGVFEESAFQNSIKFFEYKNRVLQPNGSGLGSFVDFVRMLGGGGHT